MRFLRILPAVCAMISWPFSSFTRNVALGSSSETIPGNSSNSSLAIPILDARSAGSMHLRTRKSSALAAECRNQCEQPARGAEIELHPLPQSFHEQPRALVVQTPAAVIYGLEPHEV